MKTKRLTMLAALLACLVTASVPTAMAQDPAPAQPTAAPAQPAAQPAQPAQPDVSVNVTRTETTWYMNPVLIGVAVLLLVVLVVAASRGEPTSTTTIVKD